MDLDNPEITYQEFFVLDLSQYKTKYDDWIETFIDSVKERSTHLNQKFAYLYHLDMILEQFVAP